MSLSPSGNYPRYLKVELRSWSHGSTIQIKLSHSWKYLGGNIILHLFHRWKYYEIAQKSELYISRCCKFLELHTRLLCGCTIHMMRCYKYFLIFSFNYFPQRKMFLWTVYQHINYLKFSSKYIQSINLKNTLSNDPSLMLVFFCKSLPSISAYELCAGIVHCMSSSYYWHNYFYLLSQFSTNWFSVLITCYIR